MAELVDLKPMGTSAASTKASGTSVSDPKPIGTSASGNKPTVTTASTSKRMSTSTSGTKPSGTSTSRPMVTSASAPKPERPMASDSAPVEERPTVDTDPESDEYGLTWPVSLYVTEDVLSSPDSLHDERTRFIRQATVEHRKHVTYKNVIVVCSVCLLSSIAIYGVVDLRRTLKETSTTFNLVEVGLILGFMLLGLLFMAPLVVLKFGLKTAMAVGLTSCVLYTMGNLYVHWGTVMPTAVILGLGLSCFWTALAVYITRTGQAVSELSSHSLTRAANTLFGIFFVVLSLAGVCAALISAFVVYDSRDIPASIPEYTTCGAFYSPTETDNFTSQAHPDTVKLYTLRGTHVLLCVLSLVGLCLCLSKNDGVSKPDDSTTSGPNVIEVKEEAIGEIFTKKTSCSDILPLATLFQLIKRDQIFLAPLTVYSGLQLTFFVWDISQSYVNCTLGVWMVTMTTVCWTGASGLSSCVFGRLVSCSGRIPIFVCGALVQCGVLLALFLWQPIPEQMPVFFVISGLWGISDGIWQCLIMGLYAVVFCADGLESAFAGYHFWRISGISIAVICGHFLPTYTKIFTLLSVLTLGMMGYFAVEVPLYRRERS